MKAIWMRSALVGAVCACVGIGCERGETLDASADHAIQQDASGDRTLIIDVPEATDAAVVDARTMDVGSDSNVMRDAGTDTRIVIDAGADVRTSDVVTVVDAGTDASTGDTVVVLTDSGPPVDGGTCPLPIRSVLTIGSTFTGTIVGGAPNRVPSIAGSICGGDGPEDVFILHNPTTRDIVLSTSSPMTTVDTVIRLRRICDDESTEFDCNDDVDITNTAAYLAIAPLEAGDYYLIVDSFGPSAAGNYVLSVFAPTASHTDTVIPAACDTMDTAAILPGVAADDSASAITALPFSFPFFPGETATHFSVTSNGYAQLWTSASGTPSTIARNHEVPYPGLPNNIVAPFWENLAPAPGVSANVRTAAFGTGPNRHFTIQWSQWSFDTDPGARLTFQAKLFETTGVVEFHYCTLTPGTETARAGANQAVIGIEDSSGLHGTSLGYHVMDNATTTNAYRLTPR